MSNVIALKKSQPSQQPAVREYAVNTDQVKGLGIREDGTTSFYVFRYSLHGRRPRIGMGSVEAITRKQAIATAQRYAGWVAEGKDPQVERKSLVDIKENGPYSFKRATEEWLVRKLPGLKSAVHQRQIQSRLRALYTDLGKLPMEAITPVDVATAIKPAWVETNPTAVKTLRYVKDVFNAAIAHGRRTGANPADPAVLKHHLPNVRKGRQRHMRALAWEDLPTFWRELAERRGSGAEALRVTLLTAQRTAQVIESTVDQFQPDAGLWVFELDNVEVMKTDVEVHRVAMGPIASRLVRERKELVMGMSDRTPKAERKLFDIANMTMLGVLGTMGYWGVEAEDKNRITVHGFRSTFRTWFEDNWMKLGIWTDAPPGFQPHLLAEAQLSHTGGKSKIDAAYQRSDLLALRQKVMAKFEEFVTGGGVRQ